MTTYSGTLPSEFIINRDNAVVAIDGGTPIQVTDYTLSDLSINRDNAVVAIDGGTLPQVAEIINSVLKVSRDNITIIVDDEPLFSTPYTAILQLTTDNGFIYAATDRGLVVFSL